MIIEVLYQTLYGSESNINTDGGRVSEVLGMKRLSTNTRVEDQNLYGPGSSVNYEESKLRPVDMPLVRNAIIVNPIGNSLPMVSNGESLWGEVSDQNLYGYQSP